ncbi:MAG: PilZ domain-containing protein [Gemmataceae bacterium]|nr:PilZ domain-containing protein [Gemmataceae bacterium]
MSSPTSIASGPFLADGSERRTSIRHVCELSGDCQPIAALEAGNRWPVQAANISEGGVSLMLSRRFEPGTLLAVEFVSDPADTAYMPLARVCRASRAGNYWLLGCSWADGLGADDLRTLVGKTKIAGDGA